MDAPAAESPSPPLLGPLLSGLAALLGLFVTSTVTYFGLEVILQRYTLSLPSACLLGGVLGCLLSCAVDELAGRWRAAPGEAAVAFGEPTDELISGASGAEDHSAQAANLMPIAGAVRRESAP